MNINTSRVFRYAAIAACMQFSASAAAQQVSGNEVPPVRRASEVLPPALIHSELFTVRDQVTWKEGLHLFTVDSEFGEFEVWGEPMLRVRLREVEALNTLLENSSVGVGTVAAAKQMGSSVVSLATAFRHPIRTGKSLPGGVKRLFRSVKYDVKSLKSNSEEVAEADKSGADKVKMVTAKLGRKLAGVTSAYRKWAQKVGVNPYTANEAVRNELERLAKVESGTKLATEILAPSVIPEELEIIADVSKTAYHKDWREIIEYNLKALGDLDVTEDTKARFLDNPHLNLTLQTLIIELLVAMPDVEDRNIVIDQAVLLETDAEAVFFVESMLMTEWFHANQASVARMLGGTLIPVVLTTDGRVVAFSASDFEYWTENTEQIATEFDRQYREISNIREVWVADNVSSGYVRGVSNLGWSVRSDLRASVLPQIPWGLHDDGSP